MKYITFPQSKEGGPGFVPSNIARMAKDGSSTTARIFKVQFSKEELRFIAKHKRVYFMQTNIHATPPIVGFNNPYDNGFIDLSPENFITHNIKYKGYDFMILLSRSWTNSKVKVREFEITMQTKAEPYCKGGQIPNHLLSTNSHWLKEVLNSMVSDMNPPEEETKES